MSTDSSPGKAPSAAKPAKAPKHKHYHPKADEAELREHKNFLALARSRDFTVNDVADLTEEECYWRFVEMRFKSRTVVTCPACGSIDEHYPRTKRRQWRCLHIECQHIFSVTSGTVLHGRKLKFKKLLMAIAYFSSAAKGVAALHTCRIIKVQPKTAFLLTKKLREALSLIHELPPLKGVIELDGGHFGGRPRSGRVRRRATAQQVADKVQANMQAQNEGKRKPKNTPSAQNLKRLKKRRIILVLREHSGLHGLGAVRTKIYVLTAEIAAQVRGPVLETVKPGSLVMSDEGNAFSWIEQHYDHLVVNHQEEYSTINGVNENQAESFFSRLRRYVLGIGHKFEPQYIADYAREMAWREDTRRKTEKQKIDAIMGGALLLHKSKWRGYCQGRLPAVEPPIGLS